MNKNERLMIALVLTLIALMVGADLLNDAQEGVIFWHVLVEGSTGILALFGVFYVLRGSYETKHRLKNEMAAFADYKRESEIWRAESRKYLDGLSHAIDQQLSKWKLTAAEKEVAFLLLKGMSLKEIAEIRKTAEKTARVQAIAIYSKSGLAGRSELSAFFLEDLLVPSEVEKTPN